MMQSLATYDNSASVRINPSEKTLQQHDELESVAGTVINKQSPIVLKQVPDMKEYDFDLSLS